MNQDPTMQGGNTPTQGGQPVGNGTTATTTNTATEGAGSSNIPAWMNSTPDPIATGLPNGSVVEPATPPKKKHTGLIVTLIILLVLILAGAGAAVWYFCFYNNPENVAFDAVNNFLNQKDVVVTGGIDYNWSSENGESEKIGLALENTRSGIAGNSDLKFSYASEDNIDGKTSYELDLGTVAMSDGVLYFRIGNLMEAIDAYGQPLVTESEGIESSQLEQIVYGLLETIDGEWWQISIPDILDMVDENTVYDNEVAATRKFYNCMLDAAKQDIGGELAKIYRENRFLKPIKVAQSADGKRKPSAGNDLYEIDFDYEKMANFINALPQSDTANRIYACYNTYNDEMANLLEGGFGEEGPEPIGADKFKKITAEDLEKSRNSEATKYYLEIATWGHQLKGAYLQSSITETPSCPFDQTEDVCDENDPFDECIDYDLDEYPIATPVCEQAASITTTGIINLNFAYDPVTVTAPEKYRPITDLAEELVSVVMQVVMEAMGSALGEEGWQYNLETGEWYAVGEAEWGGTTDVPEGWEFSMEHGYWYNPENPSEHTRLPMNTEV